MARCKPCERYFPQRLITFMFVNDDRIRVCPICALRIRNEVHGLPADTPFHGGIAQEMYDDAIEYLNRSERSMKDG